MRFFEYGLTFLLVMVLSACTTNPYTGEREASNKAKGAGIGAAIGAVIGVLSGDDADERRKRALIGAGVGAPSSSDAYVRQAKCPVNSDI